MAPRLRCSRGRIELTTQTFFRRSIVAARLPLCRRLWSGAAGGGGCEGSGEGTLDPNHRINEPLLLLLLLLLLLVLRVLLVLLLTVRHPDRPISTVATGGESNVVAGPG